MTSVQPSIFLELYWQGSYDLGNGTIQSIYITMEDIFEKVLGVIDTKQADRQAQRVPFSVKNDTHKRLEVPIEIAKTIQISASVLKNSKIEPRLLKIMTPIYKIKFVANKTYQLKVENKLNDLRAYLVKRPTLTINTKVSYIDPLPRYVALPLWRRH